MIEKPHGRQCGRKRRYDSDLDAKLAMVENCGHWPGMNVYLCPHCEFWHYGHRIKEDA